MKKVSSDMELPTEFIKLIEKDGFIPAKSHRPAAEYCSRRKIPLKVFKGFYYNEEIKVIKDNGKKFSYRDMLTMPFYFGSKIYGYQARSLEGKTFYTKSFPSHKIYNLYNIDNSNTIYILESILDSIFLDNAVAMIGASIPKEIIKIMKDPVLVFDNDCAKDTYNRMVGYIDQGYKVVIWPEDLLYKDVNEMIINKMTKNEIKTLIDDNTYQGVQAKIRVTVLQGRKKRR